MELLARTNSDYWQVRDGPAAFSRYLVSAVRDKDALVIVAEEECAGLAGFSLAFVETLPEWFGSEQIGLLRYLAVAEQYWGQGIGRDMANHVVDWFRSLGIKRMELYVLQGLPASGFWSKMGFRTFMDRRFMTI